MVPKGDKKEDSRRVRAGLKFLHLSGGDELRAHYIWLLKRLLTDLKPEDLSTRAIVSLVAILIPDHSRLLARVMVGRGPGLQLVGGDCAPDRTGPEQLH